MRRRASRQTETTLSLFPFLAVLICTVGALIVLLVVVVQQARVHAKSANVADVNRQRDAILAQVQQLQRQRQEHLQRLQRLRDSYAKSTDTHTARRETLQQLAADTNRLSDEIADRDHVTRQLYQKSVDVRQKIRETENALAELQRQLERQRWQLEQLQSSKDAAAQKFAVIPYHGPNETARRPIYIECLSDRVVLQPEGITLSADDFESSTGPHNPLVAALRATRAYWAGANRGAAYEEPYPLLIVRPDGAEAYAAARAAMRSWDAEFGYELVTADMELAYPPSDPALAQVLKQTVTTARRRQQSMRSIASLSSGHGGQSGFRASSRHGGFVPIQGEASTSGWSSQPERASPPGNRGSRAIGTGTSGTGTSGAETRGTGTSGTGTSGTGTSGYGAGEHGLGDAPGRMQAGESRMGGFGGVPARDGDASGREQGQGHAFGSGGDSVPPGAAMARSRREPGGGPYGGTERGPGASRGPDREPSPNNLQGVPYPAGSGGHDAQGSQTPGSQTPGNSAGGQRSTSQFTGSAGSPSAGQSASAPGASPSGGPNAAGASPSAHGSSASGSAAPAGPSLSFGNASLAPQGASMASLAKTRGLNWALPHSTPGAIGITRPIVVHCYVDRWVLPSEPGTRGRPAVVAMKASTQSAVDPLVSAIWKRVEGWGTAGPGVFWRPELHVSVAGGAEHRFREMQDMMMNSGVAIVRKSN